MNKKYVKRAFQWCVTSRMSYHPRGDTVKIIGVNSPTNGQSCEENPICGEVVLPPQPNTTMILHAKLD